MRFKIFIDCSTRDLLSIQRFKGMAKRCGMGIRDDCGRARARRAVTVLLAGALAGSMVLRSRASVAEQNAEWLIFIGSDGHTTVQYDTFRTQFSTFARYFPKGTKIEDFLYIFPDEYRWDTTSDPNSDVLHFPTGDYAVLSEVDLLDAKKGPSITVEADGTYVFRNWDGRKELNGHFGVWIDPGHFNRYAAAWILPETFEFVSWKANREGKWVKRRNTLAFFGRNVNDLVFTVRFRRRDRAALDEMRQLLAGREGVEVEGAGDGLRVVLADTVLFQSGSAEIGPEGRAVIARIAGRRRPQDHIVVEGHTDNVPIRGALAQRFPTNWELSAARALAVVHEFARAGVPEDRLEARAFGSTRPRASNATPEGRARNRRIEILFAQDRR